MWNSCKEPRVFNWKWGFVFLRLFLKRGTRKPTKPIPKDFMFALTRKEIRNISQIVISSRIKHARNVRVFIEQGVAMLYG